MSDGSFSRTPRPHLSRATDPRDLDLRAPERQSAERHDADDGTSGDPLAELARLISQVGQRAHADSDFGEETASVSFCKSPHRVST